MSVDPVARRWYLKPVIFMVEDDPPSLQAFMLLLRGLKEEGYEFVTAACSREALEKVVSEGHRIKIAILDLMLIDDVEGGFTVAKALRECPATRNVPIIILSAYGSKENREKAAKWTDGENFLEKPDQITELSQRVRELLAEAGESSDP